MDKYEILSPLLDKGDFENSALEHQHILAQLLSHRGIEGKDTIDTFLNPDYERDTHDPFLLKDMEKVVKRILEAVSKGEKIVIYSDYDTDGIPGAVVLHDFFVKIGYTHFTNYIPHRNREGFGLNTAAIEGFIENKVSLLITIDCGIANKEEVAYAMENGVDVIITDHHLPPQEVPPAYAIVNPKQTGCDYPFKDLCGAAVVYKVVQALLREIQNKNFKIQNEIPEGWEKWLLDMVGIATISDMVPLVGENRVFARYGLLVLRKSPRPGLQHLLKITRTSQKHLTETDVGFTIGPRINAASRMDKPEDAFFLLSTNNLQDAGKYATHLDTINNERKGLVASMVKEAKKKIEMREEEGNPLGPVIVMGNPHWKPSLLGLVSNTLSETYKKPSFLWGREGSVSIKGSCRSDGVIHLVHLMNYVKEGVLTEFGGHAFSGGFSVADDAIHYLEEAFIEAHTLLGPDDVIEKKTEINAEISLDDLGWPFYDMLERLSPFGVGNEQPLFVIKNVFPERVEVFGKQKNHLKLVLSSTGGKKITAISFFKTSDDYTALGKKNPLSLIVYVEKSTFGYSPEIRLRIVDIV